MTTVQSRLLLAAVLLALFGPLLVRGEVVYPHDNTIEVGLPPDQPIGRASNRTFSDESQYYIPALQHQLQGDSSGWISLWNPHNELGRPEVQVYGLGKAFFLTHVFAWISDDPFRVYTWLGIAAISLACFFGLLLFEALGLHPAASFAGALGIGLGGLTKGWLCFTLFLWGTCWTVALLWCTTLFLRRPTPARALGIAFFTNALLLTAYPQIIVWQAYLLAGYALLVAWRTRVDIGRPVVHLAQLAGCALAGVLGAVPVYLDLWRAAGRSSRTGIDPDFLAGALPSLESWRDFGAFVADWFDPFLFGNPTLGEHAVDSGAPSLTPLWATLAFAALWLGPWRRLWPLVAFIAVTFVLTVWEEGYLFAARYLGLGISRTVPLLQAFVPLVVLGTLAADRVLRGTRISSWRGAALVLLPLVGSLAGAAGSGFALAVSYSIVGSAIALGTAAFLLTRRAGLLLLLAVTSMAVYGWPTRMNRGMDEIRLDSPLVESVRLETVAGTRYAWLGAGPAETQRERNTVLGPNQESLYGLRSIHCYDPLSSLGYQAWAEQFARPQIEESHGRRFTRAMAQKPFWRTALGLSGVGLLLSRMPLDPEHALLVGEIDGTLVHRPRVEPLLELQTEQWERSGADSARVDHTDSQALAVERVLDEDEHLVFRTSSSERETLLVVSQQHHPGWEARSAQRSLATIQVNDLYQGVVIPPGTREVELSYRSPARWSWVPQAFFALATLTVASASRRTRARAA